MTTYFLDQENDKIFLFTIWGADVVGEIPNGIEIIYDYREVILEGVPTESGRFTFRVYLNVDPHEDYYYDDDGDLIYDDALCTDSTSKKYTLYVK